MLIGDRLALFFGGLLSGVLAGFLGIGGGTLLVPILVTLGYSPVQAVATSSLTIVLTSISGSIQNWRMGYLDIKKVTYMGIPSVITAQIGVYFSNIVPNYILLVAFAVLLISTIFLTNLRQSLSAKQFGDLSKSKNNKMIAYISTGGAAGILAGFFGVGGGVIMVPLQMLLLSEPIKVAIQTSLGVIVITSLSACVGQAWQGNVLFSEGFLLGLGGLLGAQVSTRFLPRLPEQLVSLIFRFFLLSLAFYLLWCSWLSWLAS